jgi:transcription elongation GreA/GreB family factor
MSNLAPAAPANIDSELQKLVDEGKIGASSARVLSSLQPGAYCQHKSWGFGRVAGWNLDGNQILIDFGPRKKHPMQLQYAAETLRAVSSNHILARKDADLAGVKKTAADDPIGLIRNILENSPGQKATPTQIAALLIPDVLSGEAEFKRWWESTKKLLKKDGCFVVPAKKTEFVEMRAEAVGQHQALFAQFHQARQLKEQLAALDEIFKSIEEFKENPAPLEPVLSAAGQGAARNQRLDLSAAFELLVTRDEIADAAGLPAAKESPSLTTLMREEEAHLSEIIADLPAAKQRFALNRLPDALGEDRWAPRALALLPQTHNARVVGEIARLFDSRGRTDDLRGYLDRSIRDYSITCEMLLWLCKERSDPKYASFANPRLFSAILSALERDQYSDIKRSTKLRDLLSSDRELVTGLLGEAEQSELRAAARALLATPSLEELDKRSLMARLIKIHPDLHILLTGGGEERPTTLIVSWSSLEKRKLELDDLVNRQIPKNIEEISIARSYGDLRENFEFKAAKEMQTVLARRRAELEQDLARSRGTNFENPDVNQVSIGTVVTVKNIATESEEAFTILGAWDGNPEMGILSYLTVIGQALLGHRVGETIELPSETGQGSRAAKIIAIVAYQPPAV